MTSVQRYRLATKKTKVGHHLPIRGQLATKRFAISIYSVLGYSTNVQVRRFMTSILEVHSVTH